MAKAKKLKSGNWRCLVYSHTDDHGKRIYESFTASTKSEAEAMAAKFKLNTDKRRTPDLTVREAVEKYLAANDGVLSPSTIYNYGKDAKRFEPINNLRIRKITSNDLQTFVTGLSDKGLSPKTVKNTYGLLRTVLTYSGVEQHFMVHLPKKAKTRRNAPENEQIITLFNLASPKMKIAIMLAAHHSLRRGEIAALKYKDLEGNRLYVHADIVKGNDGWVYKEIPKTDDSNRYAFLSKSEVDLLGDGDPEEYIVDLVPGAIGNAYIRLRKKVGLDNIRFHDLRVYFASISAAMGIPEVYTAHHGGWAEGSTVLKQHYQKPIVSIDEGYANKMNKYFDDLCNTKCNTQ